MRQEFVFDDKEPFLHKLEELVKSGVNTDHINTVTPYPVHEIDHIVHEKPSKLKFFTLVGALSGLVTGFALTIATIVDWPIRVGAKPFISIPPFIVIAYALTILFGVLGSLAGFIILAWLPDVRGIQTPYNYGNHFAIIVDDERKL